MSEATIDTPKAIHHSHQFQQQDLGDTIGLLEGAGPGRGRTLGTIWNAEDLGFPGNTEDIEIAAIALADKIVRAYNCHDDLLEALRPFAAQIVSDDAPCHVGLTTKEKCGRCSRILAARAAIGRAEAKPA